MSIGRRTFLKRLTGSLVGAVITPVVLDLCARRPVKQMVHRPRGLQDISELRCYRMDIRKVLADSASRDMLEEEDAKMLAACTSLVA